MTTNIMKPGDLIQPPKEAGFVFDQLNDLPLDESITQLYYGGSGTGKTWYVGTAGPRTLIINIGGGLKTIQSPVFKRLYFKDGSPLVVTIQEERDPTTGLFKAAEAFDRVCDSIDYALQHYSDRFDTIALDDATSLRYFASNKALEAAGAIGSSKTLERSKKYGMLLLAQQDYLGEMNLVEQFVAGTIDICKTHKKHFLMTAHERFTFKKLLDNKGKVIGEQVDTIRPGFVGKTFPDDITNHFDLVWNATVARTGQGMIYRALTVDTMGRKGKTRYVGVFKEVESSPNFLKVVAAIRAAS